MATTTTRKAATNGRPAPKDPATLTQEEWEEKLAVQRARNKWETCGLKEGLFPEASSLMVEAVVAQIDWHADQVRMQMRAHSGNLRDCLQETVRDARAIWAHAELLLRALPEKADDADE